MLSENEKLLCNDYVLFFHTDICEQTQVEAPSDNKRSQFQVS